MRPSRQMLSGELVCSLFALAYAIYAVMPASVLGELLLRREGLGGLLAWAMIMGAPAAALATIDAAEWIWPTPCGAVVARARLVLLQGMSWWYALHLMLVMHRPVSLLTLHAAAGALFCAVSYIENRRVRREIRALGVPHRAG
jgi:hypothetical protein